MLSVGLTGNVASGKSLVAKHFATWGGTVIDADQLVRDVQVPGSPVLEAIATRFGRDLLSPTGELDRPKLGSIVFADPDARSDLNGIVHPAVQRRRAALIEDADSRGDLIVVNDIPLLFEVLDPDDFDVVVLVDAPAEVRRDRLTRLRGLSAREADQLIAAQLPSEEKRARSDIVLDNVADLDGLERQAFDAWADIRKRAATSVTEPGHALLAVTAHPDDVRLIAGTLARYVDAGASVHVANATGMPDELPGVSTVALERPGTIAADDHRAVTSLIGLVQRIRPSAIITFGPDGGNGDPDHRVVHDWTRRAVEGGRTTADVYYIATGPPGSPSDVAAVLDVRPWRREADTTACGMAFEPRFRTTPLTGREWFTGTHGKTRPRTDLFPLPNRS